MGFLDRDYHACIYLSSQMAFQNVFFTQSVDENYLPLNDLCLVQDFQFRFHQIDLVLTFLIIDLAFMVDCCKEGRFQAAYVFQHQILVIQVFLLDSFELVNLQKVSYQQSCSCFYFPLLTCFYD